MFLSLSTFLSIKDLVQGPDSGGVLSSSLQSSVPIPLIDHCPIHDSFLLSTIVDICVYMWMSFVYGEPYSDLNIIPCL